MKNNQDGNATVALPFQVDSDSMSMAVDEAIVFIEVHRWSLQDAINLTGACPDRVITRKQKRISQMPFVPTPSQIRQQTAEFRAADTDRRRRCGGNHRNANERSIREWSAGEIAGEFETNIEYTDT